MKITGAKLWLTTLHTHEPFKIAFEILDKCHGILIELQTSQGLVGYGEAGPARRITGEFHETVAAVLKNVLVPAIIGADPLDPGQIHGIMDDAIFANPSAKAAIDVACYDLIGKKNGKPVVSVLGGTPKNLITDHTIGIKPPADQADKAAQLVAQGFNILKVKLGADPDEDVERIKAIREQIGHRVILRVDANQGWSQESALRILEQIAPYKIELAEQPIAWHDLKGLAYLAKRSPIPIAADESVHSPRDAEQAIELQACHIINIKLMKCGGIYRALQIAALAEKANLKCMIGGMIAESRLAVTAAAHFAAARPVVEYYDLDADLLLRDELVEEGGIGLSNGQRTIPLLPGLGVTRFHSQFLKVIK